MTRADLLHNSYTELTLISIYGGEFKNYELSYEDGVLIVKKSGLSAKVKDMTKTYGEPNPTFALEYYGLKNGETAPEWEKTPVYSTSATRTSDVGSYTVTITEGILKNYELSEITEGILRITPADLIIKANDAARIYYSENPSFGYKCTGFVNQDDESVLSSSPSIVTTATLQSGVGTYEIKVSGATSPNYSISYVNGTLTITPRTLIASVGNYERPYNEENPHFEILYDGFMGDDNVKTLTAEPTIRTTAKKTSDVGVYTISLDGGKSENYSFTYTSGKLTINKAEQTISWEQDLTNLEVGNQILLEAFASSGLPITYKVSDETALEVYSAGTKCYLDCISSGDYLIYAVQEGKKNYYSSPRVRKTISIAKENQDVLHDVNGDNKVDINDIVAVINHMAGTANWPQSNVNGDRDDNGADIVDINDVVAIISYMAEN